jgi:hypothetical protein
MGIKFIKVIQETTQTKGSNCEYGILCFYEDLLEISKCVSLVLQYPNKCLKYTRGAQQICKPVVMSCQNENMIDFKGKVIFYMLS